MKNFKKKERENIKFQLEEKQRLEEKREGRITMNELNTQQNNQPFKLVLISILEIKNEDGRWNITILVENKAHRN